MRHTLLRFGSGFRPLFTVRRAQAAQMVIEPGGQEGAAGNRHRGADPWLYVVSGTGTATVEGRRIPLRAGRLLVIERGERHTIRNTGRTPLKALNVYCPPAFDGGGAPKGPGRR